MVTPRWWHRAWPLLGLLLLALAWAVSGVVPARGSVVPVAPAQPTLAPDTIRVQGRIMYIDRDSDKSHPAAGLKVEIWDQDFRGISAGDKLDETVTDANGFFVGQDVSNIDPDGPTGQPEGTQDVFLKLFTNNGDVRVLKTNSPYEFSWSSLQINPSTGMMRNVPDGLVGMPTLYIMEDTPDVEALWTFVNLVEGWRFLEQTSGQEPGPVLAYWSKTSTEGPYYDPDERAIYLRDADAAYASVVVQQEAYALVHNAYGTLPPAWSECTAGPTENLTVSGDAACALIQGFATAYPLAVYGDPLFASLSLRGVDLDRQSAATAGWESGDTVPGRVAGALWDLHDGDETEEQYDRFNDTFERIWSAMTTGKPTTLAEWWAAWRGQGGDACAGLGSLYQNTIDYNTPPQVTPLGEVSVDEDTALAIQMADYVADDECPGDRLSYQLADAGDPRAGVKIVATSVVSITPEANWFGNTNVQVDVSDGPATVPVRFRLVVNPVNDCPVIKPHIPDKEVKYGDPIVYHLLPFASDVEDVAYQLIWDAVLEDLDAADVTVEGSGTTDLAFRLDPGITTKRIVRAVFTVTDRDGCTSEQPVILTWTDRPNAPPIIWEDKLQKEYTYPVNTKIDVDLRGMATDAEDGPEPLEWYVMNSEDLHAQVGYLGGNRQMLQFDPEVNYAGSSLAQLEVRDTAGASASTAITLTWMTRDEYRNVAPRILRHLLYGQIVGINGTACYHLLDKAEDSNDPVTSLRWFATDFDNADMQVQGQGTHDLCLKSRRDFEGCIPARFVVRDPKGAEDSHEVRTCWRVIRLYVPFTSQRLAVPR